MCCIETKDKLLNLINKSTTVDELIEAARIVDTVLHYTAGLWKECRYCYKAKEIAEVCNKEICHYLLTCQHRNSLMILVLLQSNMLDHIQHYHEWHHSQDVPDSLDKCV